MKRKDDLFSSKVFKSDKDLNLNHFCNQKLYFVVVQPKAYFFGRVLCGKVENDKIRFVVTERYQNSKSISLSKLWTLIK